MFRTNLTALATAVVLIGGPASLGAQSTFMEQVRRQLVSLAGDLRDAWAQQTAREGWLREGEEEVLEFRLHAGYTYRFDGVCDNDCPDLDLELSDASGYLVDEDTDADAFPYVSVTPGWTGPFFLRVIMYSCDEAPCAYGVSLSRAR